MASRRLRLLLLVLFACAIPAPAPAQPDRAAETKERPRICVVLSGGGARGAVHVGVLRIVEEFRVPVDCITGTSMGAFFGGLYAAGYTAAELEDLLTSVPWERVFSPATPREDLSWRRKLDDSDFLVRYRIGVREGQVILPASAVPIQRLRLLLQTLLEPVMDVRDFDDLPIPFRAVATDIVTGEKVVLGEGDLAAAIAASMAVPGVLAPIEYDGRLLVDGGVSDNMPVSVAREMGGERIIASDIQADLYSREELDNPFRALDQLNRFLIRQNTRASVEMLGPDDVYIRPPAQDYGAGDFARMPEILPIGEVAARARTDEFRALGAFGPPPPRPRPLARDRIVDEVVVRTNVRLSEERIRAVISQEAGTPLDVDRLAEDLQHVWGMARFDDVRWSLEDLPQDRTRLVVEAVGDPEETGFIRPGLRIQDNFGDEQTYEIGFNYTWTDVNRLGAEWKNTVVIGTRPLLYSEFFQPLSASSQYFFAPSVSYEKLPRKLRDTDGNALLELNVEAWEASLEVGRVFSNVGEFRIGVLRGGGDVDVRVGPPGLFSDSYELAGLTARFFYDTLDDSYFPRAGSFLGVETLRSRDWLGADTDANLLATGFTHARSRGANTLVGSVEWGTSSGESAASLFELGGFLHLSGYQPGDIAGKHAAFGRLVYLRQLAGGAVPNPLGVALYAGGSLELGNAWNDRSEISFGNALTAGSLFLGAETFLGPIYLATGYAERGEWSAYLFIGNIF